MNVAIRRLFLVIIISIICGIHGITVAAADPAKPEPVSTAPLGNPAVPPDLKAWAGILIDRDSGAILYAKNAGYRLYPASTTKILTALLALERGALEEQITVGPEVALIPADASRAGLRVGDRLTLKELLYALMLPSGSDAAYVLAVHVGGEGNKLTGKEAMANFAGMMNRRAAALGAYDSHFVNPDGFHDPDHYSTPYDMALIAREAMKNPAFREVVATPEHSPRGNLASQGKIKWENTNKFLNSKSPYYMSGVDGIKTGTTRQAGYCLISSASRGDRNLIAVVLRSNETDLYQDSRRFLEFGFLTAPPVQATASPALKSGGIPKQALPGAVALAALVYIGSRLLWNYRHRKQSESA
ncbi:MAG: D-alanyl-D-alanine carboxypeptidase family protein [Syntrophomonadaceae bacterium]